MQCHRQDYVIAQGADRYSSVPFSAALWRCKSILQQQRHKPTVHKATKIPKATELAGKTVPHVPQLDAVWIANGKYNFDQLTMN